jgi:hypothetical protein
LRWVTQECVCVILTLQRYFNDKLHITGTYGELRLHENCPWHACSIMTSNHANYGKQLRVDFSAGSFVVAGLYPIIIQVVMNATGTPPPFVSRTTYMVLDCRC